MAVLPVDPESACITGDTMLADGELSVRGDAGKDTGCSPFPSS